MTSRGVAPRSWLALRRDGLRGLGMLVALQGVVAVGLLIVAAWRKRRGQFQGFPHADFPEVPLGNHTLRVFSYGRELYDAMLAAIDAAIDRAEERIRLTTAYFIPDRVLRAALTDAAGRRVDVQVLLPWISNHTLADWMARGLFDECLRAGVRIFGYKAMIHAKTCTIDGEWSTIGTANLDRLSAVGNYEINAEIYSRELAAQMEELFTRDKTNATELTRATWEARPWYAKVSERLLAPLHVFF